MILMIANTLEYLYANTQIMEIIELIERDSLLDEIKPIKPSDIVNLGLALLRIFIDIHQDSTEDNQGMIDDINKLSESPLAFVRYANNTIDNQRSNNETLQDVLLAIETIDDKDLLINKILSREILK